MEWFKIAYLVNMSY